MIVVIQNVLLLCAATSLVRWILPDLSFDYWQTVTCVRVHGMVSTYKNAITFIYYQVSVDFALKTLSHHIDNDKDNGKDNDTRKNPYI